MSNPAPPPSSPRPGARGPITVVVISVVLLVAAVTLGVVSVFAAARALPLGVLTFSGEPGDDVLLSVDSPGTGEVELLAGREYGLLLVEPSAGPGSYLEGPLDVTGPDGAPLPVADQASTELDVKSGGYTARVAGAVHPTESGTHTVVAPPTASGPARVMVVEMPEVAAMVTGIVGGTMGIILAIFLGIAGTGTLVWGLVWWARRRSASAPARSVLVHPRD